MKIVPSTLLLVLVLARAALSGWYECYNFEGRIGDYPITLSFQVRDGYFGAAKTKDFNLVGVYKYDRRNTPISLQGRLDRPSGTIVLHELDATGAHVATFAFPFSRSTTAGTWTSESKKVPLPLQLRFASELREIPRSKDDPGIPVQTDVPVLMAASTREAYFVGRYRFDGEPSEYARVRLTRLDVLDKKSDRVIQSIPFQDEQPAAGIASTIIYDNVQLMPGGIWLYLEDGRMGAQLEMKLDRKTQKYRWTREALEALSD